MKTGRFLIASLLLFATLLAGNAEAVRESRISATKHNLSSSGTGTTHSTTESQICIFCHTPHGSDTSQAAPLWNKTLANTTYTPYTSSSLDAATIQGISAGQPLGSSKLCLSCHDGVMVLGSVRVLRGQLNQTIGGGTQVTMPAGNGATTGYTRLLGTDLTNDHPISVTFDATLSDRDGELRRPTMSTGSAGQTLNRWGTVFGVRNQHDTYKPMLPLEPTGANGAGQVQCTTCHDPHIRETNLTNERNIKFLRANRFQTTQPTSTFSASNDIICLSCHDKGMQGAGDNTWAYSVHANSQVATQTYKTAAADTSEFPSTTSGATNIPVWKAACLNCHDTHTVQGARRLLREGTDASPATALYLGGYKAGGAAALEETCYQCHTDTTNSILNSATSNPPNIKQDFARTYRMRIRSVDQPAGGTETHDVGGNFNDTFNDCTNTTNKCGADLIESRTLLGNSNANNRHVECSDCHNPHRVAKFQRFDGVSGSITGAADGSASHVHHATDSLVVHNNIASGALRGSWGVEPIYTTGNASFQLPASNFTVRRGDPGTDTVTYDPNQVSPPDAKTYVTREYQVCLKCHSSYGYGSTPPNLDATNVKGLTPAAASATAPTSTSNLVQYTDQAKEFQAPTTHKKDKNQVATTDSGAAAGYQTNNHRSWHPVLGSTGRDSTERGGESATNWNHPFQNIGTQTMYCSDCHGSQVTSTSSVIPNSGNAWGPHGSDNPFILKGIWNKDSKSSDSNLLCFKCHNQNTYSGNSGARTGFWLTDVNNDGHKTHRDKINCCGGSNQFRCSYCHVAVPHGWKNKALLVNLNDVGPEVGLTAGTQVRNNTTTPYSKAPYYLNAILKVRTFAKSGAWTASNCGSAGAPGNGQSGTSWMKDSNENCQTPP